MTLTGIRVGDDEGQVVITLTATGPISGQLQKIAGAPTRVFVDLRGVTADVATVTPVNRGAVLRVRVGKHAGNPPTTRVVVDLARDETADLERGATDQELRVVFGASGVRVADLVWCVALTDRVMALLEQPATPASPAAMLATTVAWDGLEHEVRGRNVAPLVQSVHAMLLDAVRLGRIGFAHPSETAPEQAAAARAGARLLVDTARLRLSALPQ